MNRRELLARLTGIAGASAVAPVLAKPEFLDNPDPKRVIAVFRSERPISPQTAENIKELWLKVTQGTDWEGTKAVVLSDGLTLDMERAVPPKFPTVRW